MNIIILSQIVFKQCFTYRNTLLLCDLRVTAYVLTIEAFSTRQKKVKSVCVEMFFTIVWLLALV